MTKFESLVEDFEKAINRFSEVLDMDKDEKGVIRDSAIQRFEFTFELAWKIIKAFLEEQHNIRCVSPKNCFREAFSKKIIEYSDFWIKMADIRNDTVHTYKEEVAEKIYAQLPNALKHFEILLPAIKNYKGL